MGNWSDEDDAKLAQLFRQKKVSSTDIHKDTIHKVLDEYFPSPNRKYRSFAPLFRLKCAQWNLNSHLLGRRKKKFFGNTAEAGEEEESEGSDYEDEGEEDIDLEDFEEEDEADLLASEEEDTTMPPKKKAAAKKTPPLKKKSPPVAAPTPAATQEDDDLNAGMEGMSILSKKEAYSMDVVFPHFLYCHFVHNREHCKIEAFVPTLPNDSFKLKVASNKVQLMIYMLVPTKFVDEARMDKTNADDDGFNVNTHQNTSYKNLARKVKKDHQDERNPVLTVIGEPMIVDLPFPCEDDVIHNVIYQRNKLMDRLMPNHRQFLSTLQVDLTSIEKAPEEQLGGFKIVESEDDDGDGEYDDEEM